jgi:phosphoglucomutase
MAMAIAKAKEVNADLVVASDPDADRIGCVIRDSKGEYQLINGNQIVMILLNYIMIRNREMGKLTGNEFIVKTIVTTETIKAIAENNNIKMYDCYTGFKWIASVIRELEGKARYIGGGEESYGFLAEDFARDKDSVSAISLMAEICAWAKDRGLDFNEMLQDIYLQNGFSHEEGISVVRQGKSGAEEIVQMMKDFRANPPKQLGGSPIVVIKDYANLTSKDLRNGKEDKLDFPVTSNVLQYFTEDGSKVSVRPSGTEPKIKFYVEVHSELASKADYDKANADAVAKVAAIKKDLGI